MQGMDFSLGPELEKNGSVQVIHAQSYSYWLVALKHTDSTAFLHEVCSGQFFQ